MCEHCGNANSSERWSISIFIESLLTGKFDPTGLTPGGNKDIIIIGDDGKLRLIRRSTKSETIQLKNIDDLDSSIIPAFMDYWTLNNTIQQKTKEAKQLQIEVEKLESDFNERHIDLKFDISFSLPYEHTDWFGRDDLYLVGKDGQIILTINGKIEDGFILEDSVGQPLLETQNQIETEEKKAKEMRNEINILSRQTGSLPEFLNRKGLLVQKLIEEHIIPDYKDDKDILELNVGFNKNGEPKIIIIRQIDEDRNDLSAEEEAVLKAIGNLMESRGEAKLLPPLVREALDLPPQIADLTDNSKNNDPPKLDERLTD